MRRCKSCRMIAESRYFNEERICISCEKGSNPNRNLLEIFGWGDGASCSLSADESVLIWTHGTGKVITIPIPNVQEFSIVPPGTLLNGRVTIHTAKTHQGGFGIAPTGLRVTMSNPIELRYAQNIQKYIADFQANAAAPSAPTSVADELVKLNALVEQGILTQEEFDHKKKVLLGL